MGLSLGPVVVNGLYAAVDGLESDPAVAAEAAGTTLRPGEAEALRDAAEFRRRRHALQQEQVARLETALPLPQLRLPFLFTPDIGLAEVEALADVLAKEIEGLQ